MEIQQHHKLLTQVRAFLDGAEIRDPGLQLRRLEIETEPRDLLAWLRRQSITERSYWCDRDGDLEIAGLGRALTVDTSNSRNLAHALEQVRAILVEGDAGLRFLGGVAFDRSSADDPMWEPWGGYAFWVPGIEILRQGQSWTLAVNIPIRDVSGVLALCAGLDWEEPIAPVLSPGRRQAVHPTQQAWQQAVERVTAQLGERLGKLVLACRQDLSLSEPVDACAILDALRRQTGPSYDFLWQQGDSTFLAVRRSLFTDGMGPR